MADDAQGGDVSARSDRPSRSSTRTSATPSCKEAQLFVDSQLRADRSIVDLVTADYSFLNERLARHYGVPDVYGERFRRVTFTDGVRGGVLGLGGVLMVTSYPDRTAPVSRGLWVLDNLLGMPPPPPPGNVPDLEEAGETAASDRCASRWRCTAAIRRARSVTCAWIRSASRWRSSTRSAGGGRRVPACRSIRSAVFPDGTRDRRRRAACARSSPSRRDQYVETFTAKLLTYALGRLVDYRDQPAIRKIAREAAAQDHRWSAIIPGIVKSAPFRLTAVPALATAH